MNLISEIREHQRFYILYLLFLILLTVVFTWPLITNINGSIYGYSGDSFGFIYYLWWWKSHLLSGSLSRLNMLNEAPFGSLVPNETGNIIFFWPTKFLALLFNDVISYNINLLFTFPLSAIAYFVFIYEITKKRLVSFVFSLIFAFSPYHFWKAYNHLDLTMIQYIPIYLWSQLLLFKNKSIKESLICGISLSLLVLLNFYYGFFGFLTLLAFFLWEIVTNFISDHSKLLLVLKYYILSGFVCLIISVPFILPVVSSNFSKGGVTAGSKEVYTRPLDNLLLLSARPWNYLLPSIDNPLIGNLSTKTYDFISGLSNDFKTKSPFPHETTIFLGYFSIALFIIALVLRFKRLLYSSYFNVLIFSAVFLFIISMPPFIIVKGITFYFPSYFFHQVLPMFRSYGRLGIFILPIVGGVASLGFLFLYEKLSGVKRALLLVSSVAFILIEFTNVPPFHVTDFSKVPEVYLWLKSNAGNSITVEYPESFNLAEGEIFQRIHGKKTINFHSDSPFFGLWKYFEDIYEPDSYKILSSLGVKYAVFHKKLMFNTPNPADDLWAARAYNEPIKYDKLPESLKKIKDFDDSDLFAIDLADLYRTVVISKTTDGNIRVDMTNAEWVLKDKGELFLINISGQDFKGRITVNNISSEINIPIGKTIKKYTKGTYNIDLIKL